jgi:heat shock protein HslJ
MAARFTLHGGQKMKHGMLRVAILLVCVTLLATAGCVPDLSGLPDLPGLPGAKEPDTQPTLKGTSWVLEHYGESGNLTPAIPGREPTISFTAGELTGSAGCNAYFGSYTSDTDGSLEISHLGNTEMYCVEDGVMDQEQAFLEALAAANKYKIVEATLYIMGGGKVLVLVRGEGAPGPAAEPPEEEPPEEEPPAEESPVEQPALKNTSWELEAYGTPGHLTAAIPGKEPTLAFTTGDVNGSGGCNSFFGTYTSDTEGTLEITGLGSTMMLCTNVNVMNQEHAFLEALGDAETYEVVGEDLRIEGGGKVLLLVESEEEPAPVEQPPLKNTSWELEAYGTPGHLTAAIPGKEPTLAFTTGDVNGSGGCNSFFGTYTSDTDGSLEMIGISSTMMLCMDVNVRNQEHAFLEALQLAETYEVVGGDLRISGGGKLLVLTES